jgi:hypothetical protein
MSGPDAGASRQYCGSDSLRVPLNGATWRAPYASHFSPTARRSFLRSDTGTFGSKSFGRNCTHSHFRSSHAAATSRRKRERGFQCICSHSADARGDSGALQGDGVRGPGACLEAEQCAADAAHPRRATRQFAELLRVSRALECTRTSWVAPRRVCRCLNGFERTARAVERGPGRTRV